MEPKGDKRRFPQDTFTRASRFVRFPIATLSSPYLLVTGHVQTHEKVFELHIATTLVPYMIRLTPLERSLFEIILIHKLMCQYERENMTDRERRSRIVLGCMFQHRLTELLVEVHHEEIEKIFLLGRAHGIDQALWETHFIGAVSCARTICTFLELDDYELYLPTVYEDVILGVDLIVLNKKGDDWCISIKSGRPSLGMVIEHVHTRPHEDDPAYRAADRRRIFDGAYSVEQEFDGKFRACRIVVGKTNERAYDLSVYHDDIERVRSFMNTDRSREFISRTEEIRPNQRSANDDAA